MVTVQEKYRRADKLVDKEIRESVAIKFRSADPPGFSATSELTQGHIACTSMMESYSEAEHSSFRKVQSLKSTSPFVNYSAHVVDFGNKATNARSAATGKADAEIDTSLEDAVAWIFDYCDRIAQQFVLM